MRMFARKLPNTFINQALAATQSVLSAGGRDKYQVKARFPPQISPISPGRVMAKPSLSRPSRKVRLKNRYGGEGRRKLLLVAECSRACQGDVRDRDADATVVRSRFRVAVFIIDWLPAAAVANPTFMQSAAVGRPQPAFSPAVTLRTCRQKCAWLMSLYTRISVTGDLRTARDCHYKSFLFHHENKNPAAMGKLKKYRLLLWV